MTDIEKEFNKILDDELKKAVRITEEVQKELADEAVKELKSTSPRGSRKRRKYTNSWRVTEKNGSHIVHNKEYRLTHLLEKGHLIVAKNGKIIGRARAFEHIRPVEEKLDSKVERKFRAKWKS